MDQRIKALIHLYIPFDFDTPRIIGRQGVFDKQMELLIRPMQGEKLWVHDFFADALHYDGEPIICAITSIEHGAEMAGDKLVPIFYIEAKLVTDDQYHEEEMRQIHQSLKDNGWNMGLIS